MFRFLTVLLACFASLTTQAQTIWETDFGLPINTFAIDIQETSDGNHILFGATVNGSDNQCFLLKFDDDGEEIWFSTYPVNPIPCYRYHGWVNYSPNDLRATLIPCSDGGFVIGGTHVVRIDSNGDVLWTNDYPARDIVELPTGEFMTIHSDMLRKLTSNGAPIDSATVGLSLEAYRDSVNPMSQSSGDHLETFNQIELFNNGTVIIGGEWFEDVSGSFDIWGPVVTFISMANLTAEQSRFEQLNISIGMLSGFESSGLITPTNGNFSLFRWWLSNDCEVLQGTGTSHDLLSIDSIFSSDGIGESFNFNRDPIKEHDSGWYTVGFNRPYIDSLDLFVYNNSTFAQFDSDFDLLQAIDTDCNTPWGKRLVDAYLYENSHLYMAGTYSPVDSIFFSQRPALSDNSSPFFVCKLDPEGCPNEFEIISSVEDIEEQSFSVHLTQSSHSIVLSWSELQPIDRIVVVNIQGMQVHDSMVNGRTNHEIELQNLAPGVYFIQAISDHDIVESMKFIR